MIRKRILNPHRVRRINGGFSFIPHRFITGGFLSSLSQKELLLYLFLILVSDRYGLSYYSYDSICSLLQITLDQYIKARDVLMDNDLIAFDGTVFQVLDLPTKPKRSTVTGSTPEPDNDSDHEDPAVIAQIIRQSLRGIEHNG